MSSIKTQQLLQNALLRQLLENPAATGYAILDGAANPALLDHLYAEQPEFACLYRGELPPDLAESAPYLVRLEADSGFTQWLTRHCWGAHWGIFALADCDFRTLHRHLRKFTLIYHPDSRRSLLFRYYDPRVLSLFLPKFHPDQAAEFFGPVQAYLAENQDGSELNRYYRKNYVNGA